MCVATGWACSGCFSFSKALAEKLIKAGETTGDRIWRMPVFRSHKKKIAPAQLADINNTGLHFFDMDFLAQLTDSCYVFHFLLKFFNLLKDLLFF